MKKLKKIVSACVLCLCLVTVNIHSFAAEIPVGNFEKDGISPRLTLQLRPSTTLRKSVIAEDYGDLLINIDATLMGVMTTNDMMTQILSADSANITVNTNMNYGFSWRLSNVYTSCQRGANGATATFTANFTVTVTNNVVWNKVIPCTMQITVDPAGRILSQSIV